MHDILKDINSPQDIKKLSITELEQLAAELRDFLISVICDTGGHLAPSLGVTELTLALHYIYNAPDDKLIWDVGHQAYIHKIITGRRDKFHTLRQFQGISGFPKRSESPYDHFGVGHASTSISAALGFAKARDLKGDTNAVVAIIGDGSMTGGMAFEGLNNSGSLNSDFTVILNDNNMSISKNVGALSRYLTTLITAPSYNRLKDEMWKITGQMKQIGPYLRKGIRRIDKSLKSVVVPGLWFERLGFRYIGPIDGHNLGELIYVLKQVKKMHGPVLVHVITTKGKGYRFAEENATKFHGLGSFNKETGLVSKSSPQPSYSKIFGKILTQLAHQNQDIVAVSAAMSTGCGLDEFA
ncbi:1-deoxy-D-xylulose-5-phosphate synthase, partial [bacterium]|nr:1-deoxy-D-xylulose-5-phosphate synthase [bacterium]